MNEILKTHALTKIYGKTAAVNNADMTIYKGDIYGFIGANGSGKTTMIRLITGLAIPTSGTYTLFGTNNSSPDILKARRRISAIVEAPAIYTNMTAAENLNEQCRILGIGSEKNDGLLETVDLSAVARTRRKAGNFSLGMRQRLGIAMSLLGSPEFMILDEPLNGLDPQGIIDIRELILNLNRESGITFLISSHILRELSLVATRYGFISNGKIVKEITADDLHRECKKSTDIELDDPAGAAEYLKEKLILEDYSVIGRLLRVHNDADIGALVAGLQAGGFRVLAVNSRDDNLEDYYLKVTGGGKHA